MPRTVRPLLAVLLAVSALLAGCGSAGQEGGEPAADQAAAHPPAQRTARVTKMLVFVVENHSVAQMRDGMPWVYRLAKRYGHTTAYHGIRHPSLPNYLAMAGGSTFGVSDDRPPSAHRIRGASVFGRARSHGASAKIYADSMTSNCQLTNSGRYAVRHNPWTYFADERTPCRRFDRPLSHFGPDVDAGALPRVGMVIPNLCHDAHDCALSYANSFLKSRITKAMSGPDWKAGRLAIVVTADEDDGDHGNLVLTVVAHPSLSGKVVSRRLNHYGLSRSLSQVSDTAPLRNARDAASLLGAFGLPLG